MDLFFDNPVVALTNGIARSLSARNAIESQRQLDRLYVQAPNHSDLAAFDQLVRGLDDLSRPVEDPAARLEFLDCDWTDCAASAGVGIAGLFVTVVAASGRCARLGAPTRLMSLICIAVLL